jgi:signal peptidase II
MTLFLASALAVWLADRAAKALVRRSLAEGQVGWRWGPLEIRRVTVRARRPMSLRQRRGLVVLWLATIAGLGIQVAYGTHLDGFLAHAALGAATGGAASNLGERIRSASVLDFVKVGGWPVFNIADVGISCGALIALYAWT